MRTSTTFALIASALGLASASDLSARQEAARFGAVDVSPSTVKLGQEFTVKYNSTTARQQPKFLDVFIQGTFANGSPMPQYQLLRSDFTSTNHIFEFNTTLPITNRQSATGGYEADASYLVIAFITYPIDDGPDAALTRGGTTAPIAIDLD